MTIVEFFDPKNYYHLAAYNYLEKNGVWPIDFEFALDENEITYSNLWQTELIAKLAEAYMKQNYLDLL